MTPTYCDFCGSSRVAWSYPCGEFTILCLRTSGPWNACDTCHLLIEANENEALALRSNNTLIAKLPSLPDDPTEMQIIQDGFRQHRTGPAVPYRKDAS